MKKIILVLFIASLLMSCGKKEVKPVSPDSKLTEEAIAISETIRTAFVKKDLATIQKNSTEEGYKNITANTKNYDSVELAFTPRWSDIDKNEITLNVSWKSEWKVSGNTLTDRGMAVFLMSGKPLKVSKILRGNPFVIPSQ